VRQRLEQQEADGAPDPVVSFLGLAQQLTRAEAVKLFMQVGPSALHIFTFMQVSPPTPSGSCSPHCRTW